MSGRTTDARTTRTARTRLLTATTIAVAALSLTACGAGTGSGAKDAGAATTSVAPTGSTTQPTETPTTPPASTPTDKAPSKPADASTASAGGSKNGGTTGSGSKSGGTTTGGTTGNGSKNGGSKNGGTTTGGSDGGNGSSRNRQCGAADTKTTATPLSRPLNHLLLTVTNTGSTRCDLLGYPIARFGEAQAVPPVDETTHPQAVVTLDPGESGYAGVRLSSADGSGAHGYTTTSLTVGFDNGTTAKPRLAGKGVYVDSTLRVTYWQAGMDEALN